MKRYLLASACALALASPAYAQNGISFDTLGTFGNVIGFPSWSLGAEVNVPLGADGFSIDASGGATGISNAHTYNVGGSLMWSGEDFRLAGSVNYNDLTGAKQSFSETQIGGAGQWFANRWLTATLGGGAFAGASSGGYVNGDLKGYVCPDAALDGFVDYQSFTGGGHLTDYGLHAEYLPFEHMPISIGATYDHIEAGTAKGKSGGTDTWWIGLKLYLNDNDASTLEDRQRTGTLDTMQPALHFTP
jgi:hypothetical protein